MKKLKSKAALLASITAGASVATTLGLTSCLNPKYTEYHIVSINDLHGAVPGYGEDVSIVDKANPGCFRLQKEVNKIIRRCPGSVFLSAGDENSGDSWSTCSHGQTTYPILKAMGVRYCAVGNHSWEWGNDDTATGLYDRLGRTNETKGNYFVTSNVFNIPGYNDKTDWCVDESNPQYESDFALWNKSRVAWADPYKVLEFGNGRVCLIGLTTTGSITDSNTDVTQFMSFVEYNPSINYAKHLAKLELGEEKFNAIDSFVLFTHCAGEWNDTEKKIEGEVADLASESKEDFDAIISAHSHKVFCDTVRNKNTGKDIWVAQAGTAGRYFSDMKLQFNPMKKAGKRLHSLSMEVKKVNVPTDYETAKQEWHDFCYSNGDTPTLAEAFNYERKWVDAFFSRELSNADLDETKEMQEPTKFKGYYNSIVDAISPITKEKVIPGHDYWQGEQILEHSGAWFNRALQLGMYLNYASLFKSGYVSMPSASFTTKDTNPTALANGKIKVREVYNLMPYDNMPVVSYVSIMQLANILNYNLSGIPDAAQTKGFKYHTIRTYQPDLNTYYGKTKDVTEWEQLEEQQYAVGSQETRYTSNYVCGPMFWYGIKANFVKITDSERKLKHYSHAAGEDLPIYDETAEYRVNTYESTKQFTIGTKTKKVWLPDIKIFEYKYDAESKTDNIQDLDDPNSASWKDAEYWLEQELNNKKLIPISTNDFLYKGGNDQTKMFKDYHEFNKEKYELYSALHFSISERTLVENFLSNALETGREWVDERAPANISWEKIKDLAKKLD